MDRLTLLKKLSEKGIPDYIFNAASALLKRTIVVIDGASVPTETGVPQGAVTSPIFFNLYINDLIVELTNAQLFARAYADDIVVGLTGKD